VLGAAGAAAREADDRGTGQSMNARLRDFGWRGGSLIVILLASAVLLQPAGAQTRFTYSKGQEVHPSYEGWMPNDDGSFTLYFGYMNANWLQEFDIPIGPDNNIEPGGPDQGQPTHFYPRRNPFLFTIRVSKDLGTKELIWTITANGKTDKAYASLKTDYQIDHQVISTEVGGDFGSLRDELRTNIPPDLDVQGPKTRSVKVGEALALIAITGDPDNLPARRDGKPAPGMKVKPAPGRSTGRPPRSSRRAGPGCASRGLSTAARQKTSRSAPSR
jgi:hypothetical protein